MIARSLTVIDISELTRKAPIYVSGFSLDGYSILSKLSCKIPNIYWYHNGFVKVLVMVLERIFQVQKQDVENIVSERASDITMDVTIDVLEDMNYFHLKHPQLAKSPDIESEIEIFVDGLVMETSMFAEAESLPPSGSTATRVYIDGGTLCADFEIT